MSDIDVTSFSLEQKVVYPSQGVGIIREIIEKPFKGENLLYYKIYIEVTDMVIMVPVTRVDELGIRAIVPAEEARQAIDLIGEDFEPITSDWKLRYQTNLDLLKKGTVCDIATIVRTLYHRSKIKDLSISERKLYDSAKKLLEDEIAFALDLPLKEVEGMIHAKLEPNGGVLLTDEYDLTDELGDDEDLLDDDEEATKEKSAANKDKADKDDDDDDDDSDDDDDE
jgi:CarD family transcriptional regulator